MSTKCVYCDHYFTVNSTSDTTCNNCEKLIEKLGSDVFEQLMRIIDAKVEKEVDNHTNRYEHNNGGYF